MTEWMVVIVSHADRLSIQTRLVSLTAVKVVRMTMSAESKLKKETGKTKRPD